MWWDLPAFTGSEIQGNPLTEQGDITYILSSDGSSVEAE